jgi:hypothetical protein
MNPINETFRWRALSLLAQVEESRRLVRHNGLFGENNESLLQDTIRDYLDSYWTVGSGEIIDVDGNRSQQCDTIIYNAAMLPRAYRGASGKVIVLAHAVGAVVEIKTNLRSGAGEDGTSVASLLKQMRSLSAFLDAAIQKGNTRLQKRGQVQCSEAFTSDGRCVIPVLGFAYRCDLTSETAKRAFQTAILPEDVELKTFVLDVKRDAASIREAYAGLGAAPSKDEIIKFSDRIRMPYGYAFIPKEYKIQRQGMIDELTHRVESYKLEEDCLRAFMKELSDKLHSISPGGVMLTAQQRECLYSAYNSWYRDF